MKNYERTLAHIVDKWNVPNHNNRPFFIPNTSRRFLILLFAELGFSKGVEIGVNKGSHALKINRVNSECMLYCIDPWESYPGMEGQAERDEAYLTAKKLLDPIPSVHILRMSSMDALWDFEDKSLDFVYIDGDHEFPYVASDIFYWAKKVKSGGIVAGHDYNKNHRADEFIQVAEVVDAYTKAFNIKPWFVMDEAIFPEHPGTFFWVTE